VGSKGIRAHKSGFVVSAGSPLTPTNSFACKLTFYTDDPGENDGYSTTADGSKLNAGSKIIAVNKGRWNELKGKKINIAGHGTYTVKDQCSSCSANHIDILVGSKAEASKKGVQNSTCTVL
jgi:3D (Asp-Asp-Asp) domain-containing protein